MLPCGQCIGCRSDKAQAMGQRCGHEQKMHGRAVFTLTYDDEHVPADYSVKLRDWQLFSEDAQAGEGQGLRFAGGGSMARSWV